MTLSQPIFFSYFCTFLGLLCQTQINECLSNPCLYGGKCRDLIGGFECDCPPGTNGVRCEYNADECWTNPCRNGATCHDKINGFVSLFVYSLLPLLYCPHTFLPLLYTFSSSSTLWSTNYQY